MATLGDELASDMVAAISGYGQTFTWRGTSYACVINWANSTVLVAKAAFPNTNYPNRGESVTVAGKNRQILKLNNSSLTFGASGLIEDRPFIEDPTKPALLIEVGRITET